MRTNIDWSKHELHIIENEFVTIHHLKQPDTIIRNVKFVNVAGRLLVTGDYGNWVFCRPFCPAKDNFVSDDYWIEKLQTSSTQKGEEFSSEITRVAIQEGIDGGLEEYGYEGEELEEAIEYYKELLDHVDGYEWEYTSFAYHNRPSFIDLEDVPMNKDTHIWLKYIFDAFDEICRRLKIQEENTK